MKAADDPDVVKAVGIAVEAGVAPAVIDEELREAAAGPQDELTPILLAGRLLARARTVTGMTGSAPTPRAASST